MKAFYVVLPIFAFVSIVASRECHRGEFTCNNGQCTSLGWVCNGRKDCEDGSDEPEDCGPCSWGEFQCNNGKCLRGDFICNGYDECGDNSDEIDPTTGKCPVCPEIFFNCTNGNCQEWFYVCDGRNNCGDGSDEPGSGNPEVECPAECGPVDFRCDNGVCVWRAKLCDGVDDCGDRSDEFQNPDACPACDPSEFRCASGMCVRQSFTCDGWNDCFDWSDEQIEVCPCQDNETRCPSPPSDVPTLPGGCIPPEYICDEEGIWDCPTGWDEQNCTERVAGIHNGPFVSHRLRKD